MLSITACATLFTGTRDTINFNSSPSGATVLVNGVELGQTPLTIPVRRSLSETRVTLRKNGYADRDFVLSRAFNNVSILNLASVLGWGVDALSGSIYRYDRHSYQTTLDPRTALKEHLGVEHVVYSTELNEADGIFRIEGVGKTAVVDIDTYQAIVVD